MTREPHVRPHSLESVRAAYVAAVDARCGRGADETPPIDHDLTDSEVLGFLDLPGVKHQWWCFFDAWSHMGVDWVVGRFQDYLAFCEGPEAPDVIAKATLEIIEGGEDDVDYAMYQALSHELAARAGAAFALDVDQLSASRVGYRLTADALLGDLTSPPADSA